MVVSKNHAHRVIAGRKTNQIAKINFSGIDEGTRGFLPPQSNQIFFLADSTVGGVRYVYVYAPDFLTDATISGGGTATDTHQIFLSEIR